MNIKEEIEANTFALVLLMPENMILEYVSKYRKLYKNNQELILRLCKKFEVSEIAMKSRLIDLGILTTI